MGLERIHFRLFPKDGTQPEERAQSTGQCMLSAVYSLRALGFNQAVDCVVAVVPPLSRLLPLPHNCIVPKSHLIGSKSSARPTQ